MSTFVITGSSTGIGEACTVRLARAGHRVIAGVRREVDGERLAAEHGSIVPVLLDITDQTHIDALLALLDELGITALDGLVNNAGVVSGGPIEFLPLDEWRNHFEVNVVGQVGVTKALIPLLRRGHGRVVFIGSLSGRVSTPLVGPYGASKHAIEAIAESLREELSPWEIAVSVVEPGAVRTPIWEKGRAFADDLEQRLPPEAHELYADAIDEIRRGIDSQERTGVPADDVAVAVERALTGRRPRYRYLVGRDAKAAGALERFLPDRAMAYVTRRLGP
jgi:NAD(P)-dependent dehydrogenase (short-subunit alcohol dehydrogenase family)